MLAGGCSWIYAPSGLIVAGALLAWGAWRSAAASPPDPPAEKPTVERWYSQDEDV